MEQGLRTLNVGAEYILIYSMSDEFSFTPIYRSASEERQNSGYWKGFWNSPNRPTMRYEILGAKPESGQWKWKREIAMEAVQNYQIYLENYSKHMSLEEYWLETGRKLRFIRRNPDGKGKNLGVEHWIPPTFGVLRNSNWTDILASETLSSLGLFFDNPKNSKLIQNLIALCTDEEGEGYILDFFAGSCTTAHAVLAQNREDGGRRQFIMVQLPEPTPPDSEARKAGYATIAEIGKERIRRVIRKMKEEQNGQLPLPATEDGQPSPLDLGFKVLKLTRSHFKPWAPLPPTDAKTLDSLFEQNVSPLVEGWRKDGLLSEILLLEGFPLDSRVIPLEGFGENDFWRVRHEDVAHELFVCLDEKIQPATVERLKSGEILRRDDLFICLDSALTDEAKVVLDDHLRLKVI